VTPKAEALHALATAKAALDRPLDAMALFLLRQTLDFATARVQMLTVARPKRKPPPPTPEVPPP